MDKKAVLHFLEPTPRKVILVPVLAGLTGVYVTVGAGSIIGGIIFLPLSYPVIIFLIFAPKLLENIGLAIILLNCYIVACAVSAYIDRFMSGRNKEEPKRKIPLFGKHTYW